MRFSLILATLNRTDEVANFLEKLALQTWLELEVIVVDQNSDTRLDGILARYERRLEIRRFRCARGHSRALNLGLVHARGDIVAFPDDDCWYDPHLLARVARYFRDHPDASGLTGREVVGPEFKLGSRWDRKPGWITRGNVWRRAITFTIFLRRAAAVECLFDETLGVGAGSPWGAGEETEYLLRVIDRGHRVHYDPTLKVWHQGRSGPYTEQTYSKAYDYAMGIGRVLWIARFPIYLSLYHLARPLGGTILTLACGRLERAYYHWAIFRGRTRGWASSMLSSLRRPQGVPVRRREVNL